MSPRTMRLMLTRRVLIEFDQVEAVVPQRFHGRLASPTTRRSTTPADGLEVTGTGMRSGVRRTSAALRAPPPLGFFPWDSSRRLGLVRVRAT